MYPVIVLFEYDRTMANLARVQGQLIPRFMVVYGVVGMLR